MKTLLSVRGCAALTMFGLILAPITHAANSIYTGASSVNWNNVANWQSGVLPLDGDDMTIADTTANNSVTLNDGPHTVGVLQLGTTATRTAVFTINGNISGAGANALTITNGVVANGALATAGGNLIPKAPIIVQGDQTWSIGGSIPATTSDYGIALTPQANGTQRPLTLNGTLTKTGPGELVFIGQNVGNGNIVVNQGWLKINAGSSTLVTVGGTGTITVNNGATFMIAKNSGSVNITKAIAFNDGATFRLGGNNSTLNAIGSLITFNGTVPIIADYASLQMDFTNNWIGTINSTITGNGGTITLWTDESGLSGTVNNNGTFKMRFGSNNSASSSVAWGLNNTAAYYDVYGAATNINLGSLSGSSGIVRNSNTNGQPATATVGALNTSTTFGGVISDNTGQMGLIKVGSGTQTLSGVNTYSGTTVINSGALALQGAGATISGNVTAGSGTTFGGNGAVYGAVTVASTGAVEADGGAGAPPLTLGSLTLGSDSSSQTATRVNVYLGGAVATSGLTVNGTNVIDIIGAAPTVGVYNLISYGGSIGGAGYAGFKLGALPYGVVAVLQDSGTAVQLNVTAITAEASVWVGGVDNLWNFDGGLEWKGVTSGNPQAYHDLYPAIFDDTASSFTVNLTTNVVPASVIINNPTQNYTLTGAGSIVGTAALTKDGSGTFIIANSNNYTGGTFVTNGVLQIGNGGTSGSISGPVASDGGLAFNRSDASVFAGVIRGLGTVEQKGSGVLTLTGNNTYTGITTVSAGTLATGTGTALGDPGTGTVVADGATLDVHAQTLGIEPISAQGAGVAGAGAIINSSADNQNALRYVTLNGPTTFGGSFRWDVRDPTPATDPSGGVNATLTGNGNNLTKVGTNIIAFINIGDLGLADINIMGGTLTISRSTTLGNPANTIAVYPGATLQFHRTSEYINNVINKVVVMTNGTLAVEANGLTNWLSGSVTLTGSNSVTLPAATGLVLQGPVGGDGFFIVNSAGGLFGLSGNCTYTGGTIINGGVFQVDGTVGNGANPLLLTNAVLAGIGTVKDSVTVPAGSTLAPGDAGIGALAINNNLVLASGSTSRFEINKDYPTNDTVLVSGSVAYSGNLVLTNLGFTSYAPNDSFKLFSAASYGGTFANIVPATPGLGLLWDTNSLAVNGTLKVIVLPTPNPPVVLSAASLVANAINVFFNMPVDPNTAQNPVNYQLSTPNVIYAATQISATNILLSLDSALTVSNYTLQVKGVQNLSYIPDTIVTTNVPGKAFGFEAAASVIISPTDGQAYAFGDKIHIFASGADIFGTSDQFEYVYKTFTNDFDVSVCLESEGESDPAAKAGLMVREIIDPFSGPGPADRNVMVASFPPPPGRNQNLFQYREDSFGTAVAAAAPRPDSTFPSNWFRLARTGSMFSAYWSSNNLDWVFMGSVDSSTNAAGPYAANVWVGMAVSSHNTAIVNEAIFSNFGTVKLPTTISVGQSGGNLVLSWPASSIGFTLQATPSLTPPITWTNVPATSGTNMIEIPIGDGTSFFRLIQ